MINKLPIRSTCTLKNFKRYEILKFFDINFCIEKNKCKYLSFRILIHVLSFTMYLYIEFVNSCLKEILNTPVVQK